MALPPGFLDELRDRVSLSDVVGRKVTWDRKKSNPAKGDWWAPCPFHQEKTPSFHVDDRKGFYYCFGCHAKGDAISFVTELENVSFIEAVRMLAADAGMTLPEQDPHEREREDARAKLVDAMEAAVQFFCMNLRSAKGRETREYLVRRGLTAQTVDRFELGYAPDARHALIEALTQKGLSVDALIEAGLVIKPEDGGKPFDRFRGRLMFPIRAGDGPERAGEIPEQSRDASLLQIPHPLQSRPRARGRRQGGKPDCGRGLYGRDRAGAGRVRPRRRAARHRGDRGSDQDDVAHGG
jgi:DNA primase